MLDAAPRIGDAHQPWSTCADNLGAPTDGLSRGRPLRFVYVEHEQTVAVFGGIGKRSPYAASCIGATSGLWMRKAPQAPHMGEPQCGRPAGSPPSPSSGSGAVA